MTQIRQRFNNKVIWVSGAAQGIGRGIAEYFADEGAKVALIDIKEEAGKELEEEIRNKGGKAQFFLCDLRKEMEIKNSIFKTVDYFGDLHILINNAAIIEIKKLHEFSSEEWDKQMDINLKAYFLSFKYGYPYLRQHESSYVVNMGSVNSFVAQGKTPGYIASKGAVLMLTKSIAIDYAIEGIRCNAVCPGITDTPLLQIHMGNNKSLLKERLQRVPLGRILKPKEIAGTVAYLCCEDSAGVTGTSVIIDGGYLATAEWNERLLV